MRILGLTICLLIFWSLSAAVADVDTTKSGESVAKGSERSIAGSLLPKVDWSPADRALREAMAVDPSFARTETKSSFRQATAVAAWKRFLERNDLTKEQRVFAWWRVGSLCAYNFDPSHGETADFEQAERAMERVRKIIPGLISDETLNSATVFGTLPGSPTDRARRLSEAFNWIATRTEKDIDDSVSRVNRAGYVINERHIQGGGKTNQTLEDRKRFLRTLLVESKKTLIKRITEEIEYSDDPAAIGKLLKAVDTGLRFGDD